LVRIVADAPRKANNANKKTTDLRVLSFVRSRLPSMQVLSQPTVAKSKRKGHVQFQSGFCEGQRRHTTTMPPDLAIPLLLSTPRIGLCLQYHCLAVRREFHEDPTFPLILNFRIELIDATDKSHRICSSENTIVGLMHASAACTSARPRLPGRRSAYRSIVTDSLPVRINSEPFRQAQYPIFSHIGLRSMCSALP
jgi:hypothetical protein